MNDYMFVVGVIQDSTNSCQHAVTIFYNWIYDSNEPFALPLSQEVLTVAPGTSEIVQFMLKLLHLLVFVMVIFSKNRNRKGIKSWISVHLPSNA